MRLSPRPCPAGCSVHAAEFLADLVRRLEGRDLTYALVGSIATMSYGEPRATLDIDVVISLDGSDLEAVEDLFPPPEFYLSVEAARAAVRSKSQFNVIHPGSGMKMDFFVAGDAIEGSQIERHPNSSTSIGFGIWPRITDSAGCWIGCWRRPETTERGRRNGRDPLVVTSGRSRRTPPRLSLGAAGEPREFRERDRLVFAGFGPSN